MTRGFAPIVYLFKVHYKLVVHLVRCRVGVFSTPLLTIITCTDVYQYTEDLCGLDQCRWRPGKGTVQERLLGVCLPLNPEQWEVMLAKHPDKRFVDYLLEGIKDGFRIGFSCSKSEGRSSIIG